MKNLLDKIKMLFLLNASVIHAFTPFLIMSDLFLVCKLSVLPTLSPNGPMKDHILYIY